MCFFLSFSKQNQSECEGQQCAQNEGKNENKMNESKESTHQMQKKYQCEWNVHDFVMQQKEVP